MGVLGSPRAGQTHQLVRLCLHLRFQEFLPDVRGAADADQLVRQASDRPQHPTDHQQRRWAVPPRPLSLSAVSAILGPETSIPRLGVLLRACQPLQGVDGMG